MSAPLTLTLQYQLSNLKDLVRASRVRQHFNMKRYYQARALIQDHINAIATLEKQCDQYLASAIEAAELERDTRDHAKQLKRAHKALEVSHA